MFDHFVKLVLKALKAGVGPLDHEILLLLYFTCVHNAKPQGRETWSTKEDNVMRLQKNDAKVH